MKLTTDLWVLPRTGVVPQAQTIIIVQISAEGVKYRLPLEKEIQECSHRHLTQYWAIERCSEYWNYLEHILVTATDLLAMVRIRVNAMLN
jgi:hypothetical protein